LTPYGATQKNADLRERRGDHHILNPGDILYIPVREKKTLPLKKGATNVYQATVPKVLVSLVLRDSAGEPLPHEPCEVRGLGQEIDGKAVPLETEEDGSLQLNVPVIVREITLHLPHQNVTYHIGVGDMDPLDELTGVKKRLQNLGFWRFDGETDHDPARTLKWALGTFQAQRGLDPTGVLDEATKAALLDEHGL
jgi:hypothetical protein